MVWRRRKQVLKFRVSQLIFFHQTSIGFTGNFGRQTYDRNQQLLHFFDCTFDFEFRSVLAILHDDQHVQVIAQVLPVRASPVAVLLFEKTMKDGG